jgi:hypothetical protein
MRIFRVGIFRAEVFRVGIFRAEVFRVGKWLHSNRILRRNVVAMQPIPYTEIGAPWDRERGAP